MQERNSSPSGAGRAMLAYGWNLQNRRGLPILALCEAKSLDVHLAGCFWFGDYGVLFDASRTDDEQVLEARRGWERLAARHGVSFGRRQSRW